MQPSQHHNGSWFAAVSGPAPRPAHTVRLGHRVVVGDGPVAAPSAMPAPEGLESVSVSLSPSYASSTALTRTNLVVSPEAKVLVLLFAT